MERVDEKSTLPPDLSTQKPGNVFLKIIEMETLCSPVISRKQRRNSKKKTKKENESENGIVELKNILPEVKDVDKHIHDHSIKKN